VPYHYVCKNCGEVFYSASSQKYHYYQKCPICGGELVQITQRPRIGEILISLGLLTPTRLAVALNIQKSLKRKIPLGRILLWLGYITHPDLRKALEIQRSIV